MGFEKMMNILIFWSVVGLFFLIVFFVLKVIRWINLIRYFTGKTPKILRELGLRYNPKIVSNNAKSLSWPEFHTIGGGTKEEFFTFFSIEVQTGGIFQYPKFLAIICFDPKLGLDEWYRKPISKRLEIVRSRIEKYQKQGAEEKIDGFFEDYFNPN